MGGQVLELTADKILAEGVEIGMKKGIEQGIEQGREQGMEIGIKKGHTEAYINVIKTAMAEMHIPLEQACQLVPEEVRQQCRAVIESERSKREAGRTQNEPAVQRKPRRGR